MRFFPLVLLSALAFSWPVASPAEDTAKPIKVLLITGGGFHDYSQQKDLLKRGLESRANLQIELVHTEAGKGETKPALPFLGNPDYAKGYDVVLHDECAAGISDPKIVEGVLKPHRDGIPGVNLHCAVHSYRVGDPSKPQTAGTPEALWFDYLGLQSSGHGAQAPIAVSFVAKDHPIAQGLADWTTLDEELYNNIQIFPGVEALAKGKQTVKGKDAETVIAWTNLYGDKKTRVFSTTLGHNNDTVSDGRYLDLVVRGLLWACDKLNADGTPKAGYGTK